MFCPSPDTEQSAVRRSLDFRHENMESFDGEEERHSIERHTSSFDTPTSPTDEYTHQAAALALALHVDDCLYTLTNHVSTPVYRQRSVCRHRCRRPSSPCTEAPIEGFGYSGLASAPLNTFNTLTARGLHSNVVTTPTHEATIIRMQ